MIATARTADALNATVTPAEAARRPWQVVVIGAGPAGAAAGWRLATRGLRVLLVDRHHFPRPKVCGCCLSARAIREIRAIDDDLLADTVPLNAAWLVHRGDRVRVPLPAGRVVSRNLLDARLVRRAIAAGCAWLPGTRVVAVDDPGDGRSPVAVTIGDPAGIGHGLVAEFVVIAAGLSDNVRIGAAGAMVEAAGRRVDVGGRIGAGAVLPPDACGLPTGELLMAVGRAGCCGVVRLEDGRVDVAAAIDRSSLGRGVDPARAVGRLLAEATAFAAVPTPSASVIEAATFRVTPPLTRRTPLVAGASRRILRAGDAAGYVEPFTGEGIGWALSSGRIVTDAILAADGLRDPRDAAARYVSAYGRELGSAHGRCRLVARGVRRPPIVAAAVAAARVLPWAARKVAPAVIGGTSSGGCG